MALNTYANLKTALYNLVNVPSDQLSAVADDILTLAEKQIWHDLRIKEMEVSLSVSTSTASIAIPTGFLDFKYVTILEGSDGYDMKVASAQWIVKKYPANSTTDRPQYIGIEGTNFVLGPQPNTDYLVKGVYYGRQTAASTSANPVFAAHPELYLFGAAANAEMWLGRDERVSMWYSKYKALVGQLNSQNRDGEGYARAHHI